jgi:hypothetical protein
VGSPDRHSNSCSVSSSGRVAGIVLGRAYRTEMADARLALEVRTLTMVTRSMNNEY